MGEQRATSKWIIVQSTPLAQSQFLQNILSRKFPQFAFCYKRFQNFIKSTQPSFREPDGIIAELKSLTTESLRNCEKVFKKYRDVPVLIVLTPQGFTLLNQKRKDWIREKTVILSETKSLDYILQLPRLIEEAARKKRLQHQNERLKRLLFQQDENRSLANGAFADPQKDFRQAKAVLEDLLEGGKNSGGALRVTLKNWKKTRRGLSPAAQSEILDVVLRSISRVVRNSDRVLRSEEDEFTVFLAQAQTSQLSRARERLQAALKEVRLEANSEPLPFPIQVAQVSATLH